MRYGYSSHATTTKGRLLSRIFRGFPYGFGLVTLRLWADFSHSAKQFAWAFRLSLSFERHFRQLPLIFPLSH
jgi:hypothetical protein